MPYSRATVLTGLFAFLAACQAQASEPIRFGRTPDISPDGRLVAFSYLGDIYTVEAIGGVARAVTSHPAHDINPVFSPDGQHIAFSSNRHGSYDVFVTSARGGKPKRLTFDSAADMVCGWSPDGRQILFSSTRNIDYPGGPELYTVPVTGGRVRRITPAEGKEGAFSPKGDTIAYTRGPGAWYRKNYRGSSNDDIWLMNADGTNNRRMTTFNGQDHSPMWANDTSLFYVSELFGTANIVRQPTSGASKPVQITSHKDDAVRRARISKNGEYIVYECGPDLWITSTREGSSPRKLAIEVNADDKANVERVVTRTGGATQYAVTADEKFVAFAVHGKLFRIKLGSDPGKPVQMTDGPSMDHGAYWSPDSSKLLFLSDRNDGQEDIYVLEADDPDHPKLTEAHRFKVTRLTNTKEAESAVSFSPDGKKVAFLRSGKLHTMSPDGKDLKVIVDAVQVFDYEWSPDSKWIAFARRDGSFANDLYIVPATGPSAADPVRNVTKYATYNAGVTWSANGKKLAFLSERRGPSAVHVLELEKPSATPTPAAPFGLTWGGKPIAIDWDDIHTRVKPVVPIPCDEAAISPDGTKVAFRDSVSRDLWVASVNGSSLTRITSGGLMPRQIQWSRRKSIVGGAVELIYFLDRDGQIRLANAGTSSPPGQPVGADRAPAIPFKVRMTVRNDELFQEMFDQGWRFLAENFYDDKFHGANWAEVRQRYRPLVGHVAMKEDLYALMYLMMGELNASHLGVGGFTSAPEEETAELGLIFDESYRGKGLKVAEVLKGGPADKKGITIKPGDFILAIEGSELDDNANLARLLNGKAGEPVVLHVAATADAPKDKRRRIELTAISRHRTGRDAPGASDLMYARWVARNAARVSELSGGKLGYIHIPSMDEAGLDAFVKSLYSDNYEKDAIVLDVRFNGGGYTHDQVLNYLGSKEHTRFVNRDGGSGWVLRSGDRKWHKPLVLLINNRSYSDAEIFPNAFRTLGLGKLVGEATGGFVIGTMGVRLIDGSQFRIPRIGVYTLDNVNMDKHGVKPDVEVIPHPDQLARGVDEQLAKAVEVLRTEVLVWRRKKGLDTPTSTPGSGGAPVVSPMGGK
jgi:tricorn protease